MRDSFLPNDSRSGRYSMLYGVLIGALLVALVWVVMATRNEGSTGGSSGTATDLSARSSSTPGSRASYTPSSTAGSTPSAAPSSTGAPRSDSAQGVSASTHRLARCEQVYAAQQPPLRSAASAMEQWQVHIGAMNQLVTGAITLQQATQFWNQTRVGAKARLHAFAAADAKLNQLTVRCPLPVATAPGHARLHLHRCEQAVAADTHVLQLAESALSTWHLHVRHMEMLRNGTMSPAQATQMWLHSWHEGQTQVVQYRDAVNATRGQSC